MTEQIAWMENANEKAKAVFMAVIKMLIKTFKLYNVYFSAAVRYRIIC